MAEKQIGGLALLGILVVAIILPLATFGGGSVLGYTDDYTDNITGSSPGQPPDLQPVPPPELEPVPPDLHLRPTPCGPLSGCSGYSGCPGCSLTTSPMSYTPRSAPSPPQSPSPLSPLTIDVARVPIDAVNLIPFDGGPISGGGGGR